MSDNLAAARIRTSVTPPTDFEVRESAWAIIRHSRELNTSGHERSVRWARAYLGLDETRRDARGVWRHPEESR